MKIYLFEVTAAVDGAGTEEVFRFAHGAAYNHPSAPGYYPDRIVNPINLIQSIDANAVAPTDSSAATGEVVIHNVDGAYDALLDHGYQRPARVLQLDARQPYDMATVVKSGVVEQVTATDQQISFVFRDQMEELRIAAQPVKFGGTNVGGAGIDGLEDDIAGKPKPRTFGKVLNIAPPLLNKVQLIYGWNFDREGNTLPTAQVLAVRDGGVALAVGVNHADLAALQAATPTGGTYDTCLAESLIKLGSSPVFDLTADVVEGGVGENKIARLAERMLLDAGVPSWRINGMALAAFAAAADYVAGIYIADEKETLAAISEVVESGGGYLTADAGGVYEVTQLAVPGDVAEIHFRQAGVSQKLSALDADILSLQRVISTDEGRGVPAKRVNLSYARNWTVQSAFAGSAGAEVQERYKAEYLKATAADDAVLLKFPQAPEMEFVTLLTETAHAQAECTRRQALYGAQRATYVVEAQITPFLATILRKGMTARIISHRFGLMEGKNFVLTQYELNGRIDRATLTLWG